MQISNGDNVIVYLRQRDRRQMKIDETETTNTCSGKLVHSEVVGREYGSKIELPKGVLYILRPNISSKINTQLRLTQVLFEQDMGMIVHMLALRTGHSVIECGTGSGIFTSVLSNAVGVHGKVFTYEVNEARHAQFVQDVVTYGYSNVTPFLRNAGVEGFAQEGVDAVFLDMSDPLRAIQHASTALVDGGKLCVFVPSFRQVEGALAAMQSFQNIRMFENVMRKYDRFNKHHAECLDVAVMGMQYAHTGYLIFGTK